LIQCNNDVTSFHFAYFDNAKRQTITVFTSRFTQGWRHAWVHGCVGIVALIIRMYTFCIYILRIYTYICIYMFQADGKCECMGGWVGASCHLLCPGTWVGGLVGGWVDRWWMSGGGEGGWVRGWVGGWVSVFGVWCVFFQVVCVHRCYASNLRTPSTHTHTHISTCTFIPICLYIYIHNHVLLSMSAHIYTCTHIYLTRIVAHPLHTGFGWVVEEKAGGRVCLECGVCFPKLYVCIDVTHRKDVLWNTFCAHLEHGVEYITHRCAKCTKKDAKYIQNKKHSI